MKTTRVRQYRIQEAMFASIEAKQTSLFTSFDVHSAQRYQTISPIDQTVQAKRYCLHLNNRDIILLNMRMCQLFKYMNINNLKYLSVVVATVLIYYYSNNNRDIIVNIYQRW